MTLLPSSTVHHLTFIRASVMLAVEVNCLSMLFHEHGSHVHIQLTFIGSSMHVSNPHLSNDKKVTSVYRI